MFEGRGMHAKSTALVIKEICAWLIPWLDDGKKILSI